MKNMFLVINKEKVYAYVVSVCTIITLFFMSSMINSNFTDAEETSSNIALNSSISDKANTNNLDNTNNTSSINNSMSENNTSNGKINKN